MEFFSTRSPEYRVSLEEAVMTGLPPDNGLYLPAHIPKLDHAFFDHARPWSFEKLSYEVACALLKGALPLSDLEWITRESLGFDAPLVRPLEEGIAFLELFHGPTLAFKDFGARFMARLMGYFAQKSGREWIILTATSGDTGGAVAAGFLDTPGIQVVVLYPEGKVSPLQEKQIAALGKNILALKVDGAFDDCQALVKAAFLDKELRAARNLTSANSINISRLIPQTFYYFRAWQQWPADAPPPVFVVPSGNFGNLTAGLMAARMGLPVGGFVAATNVNDVVPQYLQTGNYQPRPSVSTVSNAMDVGAPSNFARMAYLFGESWEGMRAALSGYAFSDEETLQAMGRLYHDHGYAADPHTAIGYLAAQAYLKDHPEQGAIVLATAHPAKFMETVKRATGRLPDLPPALNRIAGATVVSTPISTSYPEFRETLLRITGG